MADMQPPESNPANGGAGLVAAAVGPNQVTSSETVGSKRQRRPSVRLGDIGGDKLHDPYSRKANKSCKQQHHQLSSAAADQKSKLSKTRPLTYLSAETLDEDNKESKNSDRIAIGSWRVKDAKKRAPSAPIKRFRSSWITKTDDDDGGGGGGVGIGVGGMEDYDDAEHSDAPSKEQSLENFSNHRHHHIQQQQDGVELLSAPSETETREGEDGVRIWLDTLGLGRYAPVFEIHEVDDEVLPLLTLEDLKDMGINAVGSRRKMFSAIQKLSKGFS